MDPTASTSPGTASLQNNSTLAERLLSPVSVHEFVSDYWGVKALHVRGQPGKFTEIFGREWDKRAFEWAVLAGTACEANVRADHLAKRYYVDLLRAEFDHSGYLASGRGVRPFTAIRAEQFEPLLAAGATMRLYGVMTIDPRIGAAAEAVKADLHYPGDVVVNSVLSPCSRGVSPHFDPEGLFIFQTAGRKRYYFSERPVVPWPRGKGFVFGDGTIQYTGVQTIAKEIGGEAWEQVDHFDESKLIEVTLEPGDLLYWPAGTVHKTAAEDTGESVSLMMVFLPCNFRTILEYALDRILINYPAWRQLPVWAGDDHGEIPPAVATFFTERWQELREVLDSLSPTGLEINRMWHEMVRSPEPSKNKPTMPAGDRPVERRDRLRLATDQPISYAIGCDREGSLGMHIYRADKELEIAAQWVPFFKTMMSRQEFVAESAQEWGAAGERTAWEEVQEYLSVLCEQGFLERLGSEVDS
jgi:ribosomal protein L16 Arg81 hydroxylase